MAIEIKLPGGAWLTKIGDGYKKEIKEIREKLIPEGHGVNVADANDVADLCMRLSSELDNYRSLN